MKTMRRIAGCIRCGKQATYIYEASLFVTYHAATLCDKHAQEEAKKMAVWIFGD